MRRTLTLLSLGVAAALAPPPTAGAQLWTVNTSTCGGNSFLSCATWSLLSTGVNTYQLTVTNTSTGAPANNTNSAYTNIFLGSTAANTFGEPTGFTSSIAGWELRDTGPGNPFSGQGLLEIVFAASTENGINQALLDGQTITFNWTMTGTGTINQLAIHDQGVPTGCESNKVVFTRGAGGGTTANQPTAEQIANCNGNGFPPPPPPPIIPEPSTVVLLGTGLAGIFAAGLRRRAKKE